MLRYKVLKELPTADKVYRPGELIPPGLAESWKNLPTLLELGWLKRVHIKKESKKKDKGW